MISKSRGETIMWFTRTHIAFFMGLTRREQSTYSSSRKWSNIDCKGEGRKYFIFAKRERRERIKVKGHGRDQLM